jgi:septum site-determining protein MinC
MAAVLIPAAAVHLPHVLRLPESEGSGDCLEQVRYALGVVPIRGAVILQAADWLLPLPLLRLLKRMLAEADLRLEKVQGRNGSTLVAAAALGLDVERIGKPATPEEPAPDPNLTIHRGTLRSGDHLQVKGSVLLLGDVNPGARVSAGGSVLVWGRLRGVAHAGCHGDPAATITALQLRPLQLRIAGAVARGPQDSPPAGFTETAALVDSSIEIGPAEASWPLND